jgi:antirestriction protein ArdC
VNRWLTYPQALGAQVRRGEHGTSVVFWQLRKIAATAECYPDGITPDLSDRVYPLLRAYTVFNVAQIDGLAPEITQVVPASWVPQCRPSRSTEAEDRTLAERPGAIQ